MTQPSGKIFNSLQTLSSNRLKTLERNDSSQTQKTRNLKLNCPPYQTLLLPSQIHEHPFSLDNRQRQQCCVQNKTLTKRLYSCL